MAEPEQTAEPFSPGQKYWWKDAWVAARPRFVAVATEMYSSIQILAFFAILYLFTRLLVAVGVPEQSVKIFERVDYWCLFAVFVCFGILFVFEAIVGVITKIKEVSGTLLNETKETARKETD
jgi:hypothetical protein